MKLGIVVVGGRGKRGKKVCMFFENLFKKEKETRVSEREREIDMYR